MQVVARGKSAHAASNHLGDNAIYKLLPVIDAISRLEPELGNDPFLGPGKITVTDMEIETASLNAVPNRATIYIDRRLTFGEDPEAEVARVRGLIPAENRAAGDITVEILKFDDPSYTGYVKAVDKIFPAWVVPEDEPLVQAGLAACRLVGLPDHTPGKWDFSTNGNVWAGREGIPTIGFAPGDETTAHTVRDSVALDDVVKSTEFYAILAALIK
jgi:putative selenium metabolism hydrolase